MWRVSRWSGWNGGKLGFLAGLGYVLRMRWLVMLILAGFGCKKPETVGLPPSGPGVPLVQPWEPTEAQGKLALIKLFVGTAELSAEQCRTERQIQTGMMFRDSLTDLEGMLFVHPNVSVRSYWMKNVSVPLSIGYIDPSGRLLEIHDMHPYRTNGVQSVSANIQYALEVPQGWFQRKGVQPGAMVMTEKGTLPQTYFPNRR